MWSVKKATCIVTKPSFSTVDLDTDQLYARTMQDISCNLSNLTLCSTPLPNDTSTKTLNCRCFHKYTTDCISRWLLYIISFSCYLKSYLPSGIVCIWCDCGFMRFQQTLDRFENCEAAIYSIKRIALTSGKTHMSVLKPVQQLFQAFDPTGC